MFEHSGTLVAAYDGFDRLRYANKAFRSAFFLDTGEEPLWPDLMRRNYAAKRGTVISSPDFEGLAAVHHVSPRQDRLSRLRDQPCRRPMAVDDGDRAGRRMDALHRD